MVTPPPAPDLTSPDMLATEVKTPQSHQSNHPPKVHHDTPLKRWIMLAAVVCVAAVAAFFFWQSTTNNAEPPEGFPSQSELPLVAGEEIPTTQASIPGTQHAAEFSVASEHDQLQAVDALKRSGYREIGRIDGGPQNTVVSLANDKYAVRVEFSMPADEEYRVHYVIAPQADTTGQDTE